MENPSISPRDGRQSLASIFNKCNPLAIKSSNGVKIVQPDVRTQLKRISGSSKQFRVQLQPKVLSAPAFPCTLSKTSTCPISEIPMLIESVESKEFTFQILHNPLYNNENPARAERSDLQLLVGILSKPGVVKTLDSNTIKRLFILIKKNIIREIKDPKKEYIYGDSVFPLTVTNWYTLSQFHQLLTSLISNLDYVILNQYLTPNFIKQLISMFNSPDTNEQNSIETIVEVIYSKLSQSRLSILKCVSTTIISYVDNVRFFYCVNPSLKFLNSYFRSFRDNLTEDHIQIYTAIILPLYSTGFTPEIYNNLSIVSRLFYEKVPSLGIKTLFFLLKHWPSTSSSKYVLFLRESLQISHYLPKTNNGYLNAYLNTLFRKVTDALVSDNFKICIAALRVVSDYDFISLYSKALEVVLSTLLTLVFRLSDHWNESVRELASDVLSIISKIDKNAKTRQMPNIPTDEPLSESWEIIKKMAMKNDQTIH